MKYMLALFIWTLCMNACCWAQVPGKISYQGLLTTGSGTPVADGGYTLTIRLWDDSTAGSAQWSETQHGVPVRLGSFGLILGTNTSLDNFSFNRQLFVEVTVDSGPLGPSYPMPPFPRSLLTSAPAALGPWTVNGNKIAYTNGQVGIGMKSPSYRLDVIDTLHGPVVMVNGVSSHYGVYSYIFGAQSEMNAGYFRTSSTPVPPYYSNLEGLGIEGIADGSASNNNYGGRFKASDGTTNNYGGHFTSTGAGARNIAGYFTAFGGAQNFAIYALGGKNYFQENVGIGTTNPSEALTVAGSMEVGTNASDYQHLRIGGGNSSGFLYGDYNKYPDVISLGYNYYANGLGGYFIPNSGGATSRISMGYASIGMYTGGPNAEPNILGLYIDGFGRVGIATSSPSQKLCVNGNISYTGVVAGCSDIRYKKEITPLSSSLDKITSLRGVSYYWRAEKYPDQNFPKEKQIGLIAQEVEKVYPEVVLTDDKGYKSVDYSHLTAALIEALKEQQKQIEELKSIVKNLAEKNGVGGKSIGMVK